MGSCFKFGICHKQKYEFQNQPYQPARQTSGSYRLSKVDMEGWEPEVSVQQVNVNESHAEFEKRPPSPDTTVVTSPSNSDVTFSPSNSDVTFGETFKDANENEPHESEKSDKKKKDKSKKEKSKKEKSKKEKKDKTKSKKGKKGDESDANKENEDIENANVMIVANGKSKEEDKHSDKAGNEDEGDISNMTTLPREDRHGSTNEEPAIAVQAAPGSEHLEAGTNGDNDSAKSVEADEIRHSREVETSEMEKFETLHDKSSTGSGEEHVASLTVEDDNFDSDDVRTKLVEENAAMGSDDEFHHRKFTDVTEGGNDPDVSIEGRAYPYPEPEEQIDIADIQTDIQDGDYDHEVSTVTETTTTMEETEEGLTTKVTKVVTTETVEFKVNGEDLLD